MDSKDWAGLVVGLLIGGWAVLLILGWANLCIRAMVRGTRQKRDRQRQAEQQRQRHAAHQREAQRKAEEERQAQEQRRAEREREAERQRQRRREAAAQCDWWSVLEVPPHATGDEIRSAYRHKIRQCHPDRVAGLAPDFIELANRHTQALNAAYAEAVQVCRVRAK